MGGKAVKPVVWTSRRGSSIRRTSGRADTKAGPTQGRIAPHAAGVQEQERMTGRGGVPVLPPSRGATDRRELADGSVGELLRFGALVAIFVLSAAIGVADKLDRIGTPNIGWMMDSGHVSPTRADVSEAGLRGGGKAISINGVPVIDRQRDLLWAEA